MGEPSGHEYEQAVRCALVVRPDGPDRYVVENPFQFPDGDGLYIVLKSTEGSWLLTDEGESLMHLAVLCPDYDSDATRGLVNDVLASYGVKNRDGALILPIEEGAGVEAFADFVQAITSVMAVKYLSRAPGPQRRKAGVQA